MVLLLENQRIPESGHVELNVKVSADIKVTAQDAKRKIHRYLMDQISLQIWADWPTLVLADRLVWRVPAFLSLPSYGNIGQVGVVDVDAETGEVRLTPEQQSDIEKRALDLAQRFAASNAPFKPLAPRELPA